jgi:peptidyl-prolyl cis-trans isomerase SurA
MRRLFVLLLLPSALVAVAGAARAEVIERVVAKVNGQIITLSDFQSRQIAAAQAARVDPANVGAFLRQNNAKILQEAIDDILIMQKAEEAGVKAPSQWVDEAIAGIKKDNNLNTQEQFEDALQREGLTLGELRQNIERGILKRYVLERDVRGKVEVSDTELREEYDKLKASQFTKPPTVSLQEILVKEKDGGLERARELVAKAKAGEDFAALAKAYSAAPSKANGGEIGEVARTDMNKEMATLTASLPVGGISDPMPVEGGYRILKVTAKTEGSTTPFEAAKEKIRDQLMMARGEKEYEAYMGELRKSAQIELRVREVPLRLTGPIPEGSLLEALDPGSGFSSTSSPGGAGSAPAGTAAPAPATPPAAEPGAPAAPAGDDEIRTTPQTAPERVAPPAAPGQPPKTPPPPPPGS